MRLVCIKPTCGNAYNSKDEEPYYCPSCIETNKQIAKMVDAKMGSGRHREVKSDLQQFEEQSQTFTDPKTGRKVSIMRTTL